MNPQIQTLFDQAEHRYLTPEELGAINQYVDSLPERLNAYRNLRDQELTVMQQVADQLQLKLPQEKNKTLERSIKNALLMLRCCGMAMLLEDESYVQERLVDWVSQTMRVYNTTAIDTLLYQLLNQQLNRALPPKQMNLLNPLLIMAQTALV
jgi:hypothetical protein